MYCHTLHDSKCPVIRTAGLQRFVYILRLVQCTIWHMSGKHPQTATETGEWILWLVSLPIVCSVTTEKISAVTKPVWLLLLVTQSPSFLQFAQFLAWYIANNFAHLQDPHLASHLRFTCWGITHALVQKQCLASPLRFACCGIGQALDCDMC